LLYILDVTLLNCLLGGTLKGGINQAGIEYYNNLINQLISKGNVSLFLSLFDFNAHRGNLGDV